MQCASTVGPQRSLQGRHRGLLPTRREFLILECAGYYEVVLCNFEACFEIINLQYSKIIINLWHAWLQCCTIYYQPDRVDCMEYYGPHTYPAQYNVLAGFTSSPFVVANISVNNTLTDQYIRVELGKQFARNLLPKPTTQTYVSF